MFCAVFWNIDRMVPRDGVVTLIASLQQQEDADAIALAECSDYTAKAVLRALNPGGQSLPFVPVATTSRVQLLLRGSAVGTQEVDSHEYYSIFDVQRSVGSSLLLVVAHMVSQVDKTPSHIDKELIALATAIRTREDKVGHARTVLIGDLNANPFADGVVDAIGLHGIMSRTVAARGKRKASHRTYPFFFNPMWRFFGDGTSRPAGTCYYEPEGDHTGYYWNIFDQVLLRPSLLPYYTDDSVRVVDAIAGTKLTDAEWIPDRSVSSDHLPIRLRLTC